MNSRRKLPPISVAIVIPNVTAASPALFELGGIQIREMNDEPSADPTREYAKCSLPASFRAPKMDPITCSDRGQKPVSVERI